MEITENLVNSIAKLTSAAPKKITVNGQFECTFIVPKLKSGETYVFFSEAAKEPSSSRMQQYADVFVHDKQEDKDYECSELYVNNDYDLGQKSLALYIGIKADGAKSVLSMHTVTDVTVEDTEDLVVRESSCSCSCSDGCDCQKDSSKDCEDTEEESSSVAKETMEDCKILYCQKDLPMTKTCMCWGFETGEGWWRVLRRLSCELEALNLLVYDKWKVRIQADQVKEKFGTLRFYYSVECDNYNEIGLEAKKAIDEFEAKKDSGYFSLKTVVDEKGHTTDEVGEDGKVTAVWHPSKWHVEVTQHKEEYEQMKTAADEAYKRLAESGYDEITPEQRVMMEWLESEAEKRVKQAEDDCYCTCEDCGNQIGTDWSPRCQTTGWITYICHRCAEKRDYSYMKNGEKWQGKTRLMTKEEVKAEQEAWEKKLEEKYKDYGEPDDEGEDNK